MVVCSPVVDGSLEPSLADLTLIRQDPREVDRDDWEDACRTLLACWEGVVQGMARHYAPCRDDRPDFAQIARMALLRAACKYDYLPGRRFQNYARRILRNALIDEVRRGAATPDANISIQRVAGRLSTEPDALEGIIRQEARRLVRRRVSRWTRRLQVLIDYLFVEELSQKQAARYLGVTSARVNQLLHTIKNEGRRDLADLVEIDVSRCM